MRAEVLATIAEWYPKHLAHRERVIELGAFDVNGSPRSIFTGQHAYIGVDMRAGPGVDIVANFHDLEIVPDASADLVLCIDSLEHDDAFWLTLETIARILRPGGAFLLSVPTIFFRIYHPHPDDYWRFTAPAFFNILMDPARYVLDEQREISTYADGPDTLIAIGIRRAHDHEVAT